MPARTVRLLIAALACTVIAALSLGAPANAKTYPEHSATLWSDHSTNTCRTVSPNIVDIPVYLQNFAVMQNKSGPRAVSVFGTLGNAVLPYQAHVAVRWTHLASGKHGIVRLTRTVWVSDGLVTFVKDIHPPAGRVRIEVSELATNGVISVRCKISDIFTIHR